MELRKCRSSVFIIVVWGKQTLRQFILSFSNYMQSLVLFCSDSDYHDPAVWWLESSLRNTILFGRSILKRTPLEPSLIFLAQLNCHINSNVMEVGEPELQHLGHNYRKISPVPAEDSQIVGPVTVAYFVLPLQLEPLVP